MKTFIDSLLQFTLDPSDPQEIRLRKAVLIASGMLMATGGLVWGVLLILGGEPNPSIIPFGYTAITILNLGYYRLTRSYKTYVNIELQISLLLPFLLQLGLGGFVQSSAVITWALIAPLRAALATNRNQASRWFLVFLGLVVLSGVMDPWVYRENFLSPTLKTVFFVMNIGAPSATAIVAILYFLEQKNIAQQLLLLEQEKSEKLLLNVLPREIASILKDEDRTIADRFDAVSVLFADVVGFTPLSAELDPVEMVELLNDIFSYFDGLVAKYGLEKIRTIGDNYMVASGIPQPRHDHAIALAELALDMQDFIGQVRHPNANRLQFRIGINSGPAVAGVIGKEKFHYDVWGDVVNIAARMESQGEPGMIQITQDLYEILKDSFYCEPRGKVMIKGKGEMDTWFLVGRKPSYKGG